VVIKNSSSIMHIFSLSCV